MILIINTSGNNIELVLDKQKMILKADKQAIALPSAVMALLQQNNHQLSDLSAIGVVVGPGSFTGIRIGIAYAKGLGLGLNIPVVPVNIFEIYLRNTPDAFVALDSGRGDFFVSAKDLPPCIMDIDTVEIEQMKYPQTVGHKPFDLQDAKYIIENKLSSDTIEPAIPLYLRPSYVEK